MKRVRLHKIAVNYVVGGCSVGTYDLGRRYRVLEEGQYPPFKYDRATFLAERRNGKVIWGERVDED